MTRQVRSVKEDTPVSDVLELMSGAKVRRIPVVNEQNELVGIVSMKDIATEGNGGKVGQAVENISRGPANN
jgi:CBS-domain-containing membrane protein